LPYYFIMSMSLIAYLVTLGEVSNPPLSFHLHHFIVGLLLCLLGRGQKKYSIVVQAIGWGLFVEGLAHYGLGPFFDETLVRRPEIVSQIFDSSSKAIDSENLVMQESPIWTAAEFQNDKVFLSWSMPSRLALDPACLAMLNGSIPDLDEVNYTSSATQEQFYLTRNGILFPTLFNSQLEFSGKIEQANKDHPMVFQVAAARDGPTSGSPLPLPFPNSIDGRYYDQHATLCDRIQGIYNGLNLLQDTPGDFWWLKS
jgi:hypothetical protein